MRSAVFTTSSRSSTVSISECSSPSSSPTSVASQQQQSHGKEPQSPLVKIENGAVGTSTAVWMLPGTLFAAVVGVFAAYFPFWSDPTFGVVAPQLYIRATFQYDAAVSRFCNSPLTYVTDYILVIAMIAWAYRIQAHHHHRSASSISSKSDIPGQLLDAHVFRSRGLLLMYALSVLAGGLAHQFYLTVEDRNTLSFRLLWTLCVGCVAAASGFMGSIATVWAHFDVYHNCAALPVLPGTFWTTFAAVSTAIVAAGGWSYQRPACDIFVAGISQFPSSFYVMCLFYKGLPVVHGLSTRHRIAGMLAFILNAPLLPGYPLLVSTSLNLGQVNAILHAWLLFAWSSQGYVLYKVAKCLERGSIPPEAAMPILKPKLG